MQVETLASKTILNKTFIIRSDFRSKIKTENDLKRILTQWPWNLVRNRLFHSLVPFLLFIRFLNLLSILWTGLIIKWEFLRRKAVLWSIIKPCLRNGGITVVNRGPALALNRFIENLDNNHFNYKLRIKIFQKFYVDFESVIFIAAGRRKVTTKVWNLNTKTCSVTPTIKMGMQPRCM